MSLPQSIISSTLATRLSSWYKKFIKVANMESLLEESQNQDQSFNSNLSLIQNQIQDGTQN